MSLDAPDFRNARGYSYTGGIIVDPFTNDARLNPSEEDIATFRGIPGPPGEAGEQGAQGDPGPPGVAGAAGAAGTQGPPGPPGADGGQGEQGEPGPRGIAGATGPAGSQGPPGPPGADGQDGVDGIAGAPGIRGATGPQGPPGPQGEQGQQGEQGVPGIQGATGLATIGLFNPGDQLGLQIDAAGAAIPVRLNPLEQGENVRFGTGTEDTTSSGDLGATSYVIDEPATFRDITPPSPLVIHGVTYGTSPTESSGRAVFIRSRSAASPIILKDESSTEGTAARRILLPGAGDTVVIRRDAGMFWDDPDNGRRCYLPFARPQGPSIVEIVDDFTGGVLVNGEIGDTGWRGPASIVPLHVASAADHPGVIRLQVSGTGVATYICRYNTGTVGAAGAGQHIPSDVDLVEFVVRPQATTAVRYFVGLSNDPTVVNQNTVDSIGAAFDTTIADSSWNLQTRSGGTSSRNGTGVAVATNTWFLVRLMRYPSGWALQVNNGNVIPNTSNIPTSLMHPCVVVTDTATNTRQIDVDYFHLLGVGLQRF